MNSGSCSQMLPLCKCPIEHTGKLKVKQKCKNLNLQSKSTTHFLLKHVQQGACKVHQYQDPQSGLKA